MNMARKTPSIKEMKNVGANEVRKKVYMKIAEGKRVSLQELLHSLSPDGKLDRRVAEEADVLALHDVVVKDIEGGDTYYISK
jgi:hypothetical protein